MTREELKAHCEKQIEMCEFLAISKGEKPSGEIYEEHKLILDLLEQEPILDKIRAEISNLSCEYIECGGCGCDAYINENDVLAIIDKYKEEMESEDDND